MLTKGKSMPKVKMVRIGPPRAPKMLKEICRIPAGTYSRQNDNPIITKPRQTAANSKKVKKTTYSTWKLEKPVDAYLKPVRSR